MNDNQPPERWSEIQMRDGNEEMTVICSKDADTEFVEIAARLLRANAKLAFIEMQDLKGETILAYKGEHPEGKFAL